MKEIINKLAEDFYNDTLHNRRHIHKHPELSFEEFETSKFITSKLDEYKIPYKKGFVKTGIVAKIEGKNHKKSIIALRADMDALPITETLESKCKSENKGVMHACGHDVHSASMLTTARILNSIKEDLEGTIYIIFQPGEEKLPGGANLMLQENIFDGNKPKAIVAMHVQPDIEVGKVGFKSGKYMASTDEIYLTIKGKGGHGAMPHQITDNVLIASHIIVALQQIVSRKAPAFIPTVLSFGRFIADGATNVIPNEVRIDGTFRTLNEEWRAQAHKEIKQTARNIAKSMGAECNVKIIDGYPALENNPILTEECKKIATQYLSKKNIIDLGVRMTGEDFSYFSQKYPSMLYRLGTLNKEKSNNAPLHSSNFSIDENALKINSGLMAFIAYSLLRSK